MATAVGHRIGRDEIIWAFGPDLEPVLEIDPGETVTFETNDCFTGQITSEDDLVTEIDFGRVNSATGPVAVRGAEPGDSVIAEILDVRPVEVGFACLIPGFGQLIDEVQSPVTRMFRVEDGWIEMSERVRFPAKPMVGVGIMQLVEDTSIQMSDPASRWFPPLGKLPVAVLKTGCVCVGGTRLTPPILRRSSPAFSRTCTFAVESADVVRGSRLMPISRSRSLRIFRRICVISRWRACSTTRDISDWIVSRMTRVFGTKSNTMRPPPAAVWISTLPKSNRLLAMLGDSDVTFWIFSSGASSMRSNKPTTFS